MRAQTRRWSRLGWTSVAGLAVAAAVGGCGPKPTPETPEQKMAVSAADQQMSAVLEQLRADGAKSFTMVSVDQARNGPSAGQAAMEVAKKRGVPTPEEVGGVGQVGFKGRDGNNITVQVYTPKGSGPYPVLVYYHGGGWVVGSVLHGNPYDASCRALCNLASCVVAEVDYRLSPENKYPAAVNDGYDALRYVQNHPNEFKGNGKVSVAGESAGGNLALAVTLMARDLASPPPLSILSVYPVGGYNVDTNSARQYASAIPLDTPSLTWFYDKYLTNSATDRTAKYFDVGDADLHGLPPTTVITAQIDPLHDDGQMLSDRLKAAGVSTRYMNYDGVTHEFFGMGGVVDTAKQAEEYAAQGLIEAWKLNGPSMGSGI